MYEGFTAGPPIQIFKEKSIIPLENSFPKLVSDFLAQSKQLHSGSKDLLYLK